MANEIRKTPVAGNRKAAAAEAWKTAFLLILESGWKTLDVGVQKTVVAGVQTIAVVEPQ